MKDSSKGEQQENFAAAPASGGEQVLRSEDILKGKREAIILHGESRYRLQLTKAGKLILIK